MLRPGHEGDEASAGGSYWPSFVDVFAGFLLVFVFFVVAQHLLVIRQMRRLQEIEQVLRTFEEELDRVASFLSEGGHRVEDGRVVLDASILFPFKSATLTSRGEATVRGVARQLRRALDEVGKDVFSISVDGHADTVGGDEQNLRLSAERAMSVLRVIQAETGIDPRRDDIYIAGYGEYRPIVDTGDNMEERANRRIEVRIVPKFDRLLRYVSTRQ